MSIVATAGFIYAALSVLSPVLRATPALFDAIGAGAKGGGPIDVVFAALSPVLRVTPVLFDAIGAGVVIGAAVDGNPKFKERLKGLEGKVFLFEATDVDKRFYLCVGDGEIKVIPHVARKPDVVMRGELKVLFSLFSGKVDPDTVFFSRELEIEGDTSAAIYLKNILADKG